MSETHPAVYACPICGRTLADDQGTLRCVDHGAFFVYGPHLLVRAPDDARAQRPTVPWEREEAKE